MVSSKNILLRGAAGLPILLDIFHQEVTGPKPVFLYAHGFNGFKDWGNFDLLADLICKAGFVLIKFNFSHNGTGPQDPAYFVNLDAFAENNYSKQLFDLRVVVDWVAGQQNPYAAHINATAIYLVGHSMGGGMAILYAAEDERIKKLVTWAAISECKTPWGNWPQERVDEWRQTGVMYYHNSRTQQDMPLHYQLYEDFMGNQDRLNILQAIARLSIPILICHGTNDSSVPTRCAEQLHAAQPQSELFLLDTDHVFGRKHPWPHPFLPGAMQQVLQKTLAFLQAV